MGEWKPNMRVRVWGVQVESERKETCPLSTGRCVDGTQECPFWMGYDSSRVKGKGVWGMILSGCCRKLIDSQRTNSIEKNQR